jgi:hypothetical protein
MQRHELLFINQDGKEEQDTTTERSYVQRFWTQLK